MGFKIAISGKGGTGKTTLACLLIRCLRDIRPLPILAVDAGATSDLSYMLGVEVSKTIGDIREGAFLAKEGTVKAEHIGLSVYDSVIESEELDLVVLGRPESRGCYCTVNDILRKSIDSLWDNYQYVIIDEEPGMNYLSRMTAQNLDVLLICAEPTYGSLAAASKIKDMANRLDVRIPKKYLVMCRTQGGVPEDISRRIEEMGIELLGSAPFDNLINEFELLGKSLLKLPDESAALKTVHKMAENLVVS